MGCSNSSRAEEPVRTLPIVEEGPRRVNLADFSMDPLAMTEFDDFAQDKFSVNIVSQERIKDAIIKLSKYGESVNPSKIDEKEIEILHEARLKSYNSGIMSYIWAADETKIVAHPVNPRHH